MVEVLTHTTHHWGINMLLNDDKEKVSGYTRQELEILRKDAKEKFEELLS